MGRPNQFWVECADGYLGEWWSRDELEAQLHARTLDGQCRCGGPHRVLMNEFVDDES